MRKYNLIIILSLCFLMVALQTSVVAQQINGNITTSSADCSAVGSCVVIGTTSTGNGAIQISGTWTGTLQFEATINGSTWVSMSGMTPNVTLTTTNGVWMYSGVFSAIRVRASAWTSGTANVTLLATWARAGGGGSSGGVPILNVKSFGAVGNGIVDDTAAIQAAINAVPAPNGGIVFIPVGTYKVTATITMGDNVHILGEKLGQRIVGTQDWRGTVLDASSVPFSLVRVLSTIGNANNIVIEQLAIKLPVQGTLSNADINSGVAGIYLFAVGRAIIRDVTIDNGNFGVISYFSTRVLLEHVFVNNCRNGGLVIEGGDNITVVGGIYQNCGISGQATNGNITIGTQTVLVAKSVNLIQTTVDEGGNASVNIGFGDSITFIGGIIYATRINSNGTGPGYGIKIGDGTNNPTHVRIIGTHVTPFSSTTPTTNTILIYGSGHSLIGVTTNPLAGGDIQDNSSDTVYLGVNANNSGPTVLANSGAYSAITNTVTETLWAIATDGQIPAGRLNNPKRQLHIIGSGVYSSTVTANVTLRVKLCTVSGCGSGTVVVLAATGAVAPALSETNAGFTFQVTCNTFTTGVSGTMDCQGWSAFGTAASTAVIGQMQNTATKTVDLTVPEFVSASAQWNEANASDSITLRNIQVRIF